MHSAVEIAKQFLQGGTSSGCVEAHSGAERRQIFKARPKRAQKRNVASLAMLFMSRFSLFMSFEAQFAHRKSKYS